MAVTRALTSAVGRSSAGETSAVLIVNGSSGALFDMLPTERYAVARLRPGSFSPPEALTVFMSVFGQSAMRPCTGPAVGESLTRPGLSKTSVVTLFLKNDPSYASRAYPRSFEYSRLVPRSVVR